MISMGVSPPFARATDPVAGNGQSVTPTLRPRARIETNLGDLVVELDAERTPGTVLNFVQYVESGFYQGTIFHRVQPEYTVLGGSHLPDLKEKTTGLRPPIRNEWRTGLKNLRGTMGLHRLGNAPDSGRACFYINVADNPMMDKPVDGAGYAVFGRIVEGLDVLDKLASTPTQTDAKAPPELARKVVPIQAVVIRSARMLDPLDQEAAGRRVETYDDLIAELNEKARSSGPSMIQDRIAAIEQRYNAKFTTTPSGLMVLDVEQGKGGTPSVHSTVVVHYVGSFPDGTVFDDSRKNPDLGGLPWTTPMVKVISGWVEGLTTMQVGGKRILVVPPQLAFGDRGRRNIPKNATLFYELELIGIE
jgi:FKBP-type peptidyl-prolyl cis-trans isomerase